MTPSELLQSLAAWLDARDSNQGALRALGLFGLSFMLFASIYILVQLYRADFNTTRIVVAATVMYGGMAFGLLMGLLIARWLRRHSIPES